MGGLARWLRWVKRLPHKLNKPSSFRRCGRRERIPERCPLPSTLITVHMPHLYTYHMHDSNDSNNRDGSRGEYHKNTLYTCVKIKCKPLLCSYYRLTKTLKN